MRSMLAHATLSQLARDYSNALTRAEAAARAIRFPVSPASSHTQVPTPPTPPTPPTLNSPTVSTSRSPTPSTPSTSPTSPSAPPPAASDASDAPDAPDAPASRPSQPSVPTGTQPPGVAVDSSSSADRRAADEPINPHESNAVFGVVSARFGRTVSHGERATPTPPAPPETTTQQTFPTTGNIGVSPALPALPAPPMSSEDSFLSAYRLIDALKDAWHVFDQRGGDWSQPDIRQELIRLRSLIDTYLTRGADLART